MGASERWSSGVALLTDESLGSILERTVKGDATEMGLLALTSHEELYGAWAISSRPVVTVEAAKAVLQALRDGRISVTEAGLWSQLVRRGYLVLSDEPIRPLDIEWSVSEEDRIADLAGAMESFDDDEVTPSAEALDELLRS